MPTTIKFADNDTNAPASLINTQTKQGVALGPERTAYDTSSVEFQIPYPNKVEGDKVNSDIFLAILTKGGSYHYVDYNWNLWYRKDNWEGPFTKGGNEVGTDQIVEITSDGSPIFKKYHG